MRARPFPRPALPRLAFLRPALLRPAPRAGLAAGVAGALALAVTGCGGDAPAAGTGPTPSATSASAAAQVPARTQLAARAAAAKDRRYVALYTLASAGRPDRNVVVTRAVDGGWRVDIPGGALGGSTDVAVLRTSAGLFSCVLPSAARPVNPWCVRAAGPEGQLRAKADPRVQHPFVDWLDVLTDRRAALAISAARPLPGVRGACFSVESNSASLAAPLDVGIYCFDDGGALTGARLPFGTLVLAGSPGTAPAAVSLPGPVVEGEPIPMASPPPPSPSATVTGQPHVP